MGKVYYIPEKELKRLHDYYADLCDRSVHNKYACAYYAGKVNMLNDLLACFDVECTITKE